MAEKYCDSAFVASLYSDHSPCVQSLAESEPLYYSRGQVCQVIKGKQTQGLVRFAYY